MFVEHFSKLEAAHRSEVARHLLSLDGDSRTMRFGVPAHDATVARYVASIDFERDIVEGVWDGDRLAGVAHLAVYVEGARPVGELGISISADDRHQYLGQRLLDRALLQARLLRLKRVYVQYITRNRPMARLAGTFTDAIDVNGTDVCATIELDGVEREFIA